MRHGNRLRSKQRSKTRYKDGNVLNYKRLRGNKNNLKYIKSILTRKNSKLSNKRQKIPRDTIKLNKNRQKQKRYHVILKNIAVIFKMCKISTNKIYNVCNKYQMKLKAS